MAERLTHEKGACVRGLVRSGASAVQSPATRGIEIAVGDVTDKEAVRRALEGCDLVVHCAAMQGARGRLADFRRVNVGGTLALLQAGGSVGVQRFIHLSTINVHGFPPPADANADSPLSFTGDYYSISKAEGERAAWQFAREQHFPLVVVRPACTYGPRSAAWTLQPLARVRRGAPVLIGGGNGICNAVYIDNLVDLILLALENDAAVGQAFIGAEGRGVTWREFYGAYAQMAGLKRVNGMPRVVALGIAAAFEALARFDGRAPRIARSSVEFYSHRVVYDIDNARTVLGYSPRVSFQEGIARTAKWLFETGNLKPQI